MVLKLKVKSNCNISKSNLVHPGLVKVISAFKKFELFGRKLLLVKHEYVFLDTQYSNSKKAIND
jgi:hypothetical protein